MPLIRIVLAVLIGITLGLALTIRSLDRTRIGDMAGPWHAAPRDGGSEIDPYALAATARAGLLPLGSAEGLSFVADHDSAGAPLGSDCDYAVEGPMPPARFWTLSLLNSEGFPVADPAYRYAFTSSEVLRLADNPVAITVAGEARSGNWLPTGGLHDFILMFRLYDTNLSTMGSTIDARTMPKIERLACR